MSGETVLSIENVSKKFCKDLKHSMIYALKDLSKSFVGLKQNRMTLRKNEFFSIKDVSLELKKGETLGLLGVNGSGKTTLLKLIAGLMPVDSGSITINGRVASLIAVGAGFHPHMTGRENIFLNGAILGLSKEYILKKFDWIVNFAEIGDFLDAPISTYSSGMRVRLGFSIASCSKPDLLLLDEILAVGDRKFRVKCMNRISELKDQCAVVFVSHSSELINRICTKAILLNKGELKYTGDVKSTLTVYNNSTQIEPDKIIQSEDYIDFKSLQLEKEALNLGDNLIGSVRFNSQKEIQDSFMRVVFFNEEDVGIAEWQSKSNGKLYHIKEGENHFIFEVPKIRLRPGKYLLSIVISNGEGTGTGYTLLLHGLKSISVISGLFGHTSVQF